MDITVIRQVSMTAMLVTPDDAVAAHVTTRFEAANVNVIRVGHASAACERLALTMPQVVVVLASLQADDREALADRATAVGALLMYVDPALDAETLEDLVGCAAQAAIQRKLMRDESGPAGSVSPPSLSLGDDDDVDSMW